METCPRCKSTTLGAAEPCPVCCTPVDPPPADVPDGTVAWRDIASAGAGSISADDFLDDLLATSDTSTGPEPEDPAESWPDAPATWAEHDFSERPRRTGHDGATRSIDAAAYSPVPERAPNDALGDLPTRAVPALSSRVSADIKVGPTRHHRLSSAGTGMLAVALFLGGATGSLLLDENGWASATTLDGGSSDSDSTADPDNTADPDSTDGAGAALAAARTSLVTVAYQGCDATPVVHAGMLVTNSATVVVPLPADPSTAEVIVTTARGNIGGTIVGWGGNGRLAIVRLDRPSTNPPLTWASANRVTPGARLTMLSHQSGTWTASTVIAAGVDRNDNGVMSRIRLAEGVLNEMSIALDAEGFVVGVVRPGDTTAITASDELRPALAAFLTNGGWAPGACVAVAPTGSETGAQPGGE